MAMMITDDCVNCVACVEVCRFDAIHEGETHFEIDPLTCTECEDEGGSKCAEVCPSECILKAA